MMVGLAERFRKPKHPIVLGSPQDNGTVQEVSPRSPDNTPHVPRNFSYPTSVASGNHQPTATSCNGQPSAWDQLGEICNFSPDVASRTRQARTAGLEDPFFYSSERESYTQLTDYGGTLGASPSADQSPTSKLPSHQPAGGKGRRRSTLLGFSSAQVQATSWF
ncbi:hypothetical protein F5Y17DRAFT_174883 [Xylariaceae sp. FL0594]|nr:hypothetical protein F5Y17DRAFT_174883 [Xylariaceae sp. FL0594]